MSEDRFQGPPPTGRVAASDFDVELRPRRGGRLVRGVRLAASVIGELFLGLLPQPSLSDLVVIRRSDGTEVSRTPAGDWHSSGDLLQHVRAAAQEQTAEEFLRAWGSAQARTGSGLRSAE